MVQNTQNAVKIAIAVSFLTKTHFQQGPIASLQPHMKTQMYHRVQGGSDLKKNHLKGNIDGSEPPICSKNWPKSVLFQ